MRRSSGCPPATWTSCSIRWWIRGRRRPSWRKACRPRRAPPSARRGSTPTRPWRSPTRAAKASSSRPRRAPKTSPASGRRLRARANADTAADAKRARELGAEGIGLCRTEHMFFEGDRITAMREMIVAADEAGRRRALAKLLPMQRQDFEGIFEAMAGLPVTIRLLDPPLHEFLPHTGEELAALAKEMRLPVARLKRLVGALVEANPMLGHRGCRLGITYPEITEMQARAIFEAACRVGGRGHKVMVEVMIPLVADVEELRRQAEIVRRVAQEVFAAEGRGVPYLVGTMIELPRAALTADEIAKEADFFSFGTTTSPRPPSGYRATTRDGSCPSTWSAASCRRTPSRCSIRKGSAS